MNEIELVLDAKALLGEGPSWDNKQKLLYWVDILNKKVHIYDPDKNIDREIDVDLYVGAVVPRESGGLVLACENGFYTLDINSESLTLVQDPETEISGNRFNDGKCDAAGRFWAGTMDNEEIKTSGSLYCLDTDLTVRQVLNNIGISNGIAWEKDNKTMYYIDTFSKEITAFDYDLETANIENKRIAITFLNEDGFPDGMTIDEEGMLWIAHYGGSQVSRWNPKTGEKLTSIKLPCSNITSCVFGGDNLDELYITSARKGLDEKTLSKQPQAGGLFRIKLGIRGSEIYCFKG